MEALSSLNETGSQAGCANIHFAGSAVYFYLYRFYIRIPDFVGSSMGMADSITKVSSFLANCTFCHDLHLLKSYLDPDAGLKATAKIHNNCIIPESRKICK